MRKRTAAITSICVGLIGLAAPSTGVADTHCPNVRACFWEAPNYSPGDPVLGYQQNSSWTGLPGTGVYFSMKNRFNNRKVMIAERRNGELQNIRCVPPDGNRELLNTGIDNFRVGDSGSDC